MSDNSDNNTPRPDLSALTEFQLGPAWARSKDKEARREFTPREPRGERGGDKFGPRRDGDRDRRGGKPFSRDNRDSRDRDGGAPRSRDSFSGERRNDRFPRGDRNDRGPRSDRGDRGDRNFRDRKFDGDRNSRPERPPLEPTPGIRVEIRPVDAGLASVAEKIHKHKRCFSLFDLAKFFMGARDRYEIWYIKEENGPEVFFNKKTPAIWLTEQEAISSLWGTPLISELYEETIQEVEAPKGQFSAIGRCGFSETLIGPVNWHGYQQAIARIHAERFSNMTMERYRSRIVVDKTEEAVAQWMEAATKKSVWKPKREGADELVFENRKELEEDFIANHFNEIFEKTGKCHVLGDIQGRNLSQGLFAHLLKLAETARRHPAQIIPNICHGLARHHLPIFKWNGGHHTGPSRPHSLPTDTKLATRPAAIVEWIQQNPGTAIDVMINKLIALAEEKESPKVVEATAPVATQEEAHETQSMATTETVEVTVTETAPEAPSVTPTVEEETTATETSSSQEIFSAEVPALEENIDMTVEKSQPEAKPAPAEGTMTKAQTEWLTDLLWLLQQGFIIVTSNGKAYWPKTGSEASPEKSDSQAKKNKKKKAKKSPAGDASAKPKTPREAGEKKPFVKKPTTPVQETKEETPVEKTETTPVTPAEETTTAEPAATESVTTETVAVEPTAAEEVPVAVEATKEVTSEPVSEESPKTTES